MNASRSLCSGSRLVRVFQPSRPAITAYLQFPTSPVAEWPSGLFLFLGGRRRLMCVAGETDVKTPIVSGTAIPYTTAAEHRMTLLNRFFTTRTLVKIVLVLSIVLAMKAASLHYDFSWATALAAE
jgi:hypothetical protein